MDAIFMALSCGDTDMCQYSRYDDDSCNCADKQTLLQTNK